MGITRIPAALPALAKPTLDTPFHIDLKWWERAGLSLAIEMRSHLCSMHREVYAAHADVERIDWVDERTGEVTQVDGLQHVLRVHCSKQPDYIHDELTIVDAVLRVFLANGNKPLSCRELSAIIGRPPERILGTVGGLRVYKGIRPAV
jgi:hypothetical protein